MFFTVSSGCGQPVQSQLASLSGIGESNYAYAHAISGCQQGSTSMLVGLGNWTNTYVHPCKIFIYEYFIATDTYEDYGQVIADVMPTAAYPSSQPSVLVTSTDLPIYVTVYPGVGVEKIVFEPLTNDYANGAWTWGSSFAQTALVACKATVGGGIDAVTGYKGTNGAALRRWSNGSPTAQATGSATATGWQTLHIHQDHVYVYGVANGGATVFKYDLATLTEQTNFATPTGSGTIAKLFSRHSNSNIWIMCTVAGANNIYERVGAAWVLRYTTTGAFPFTAEHLNLSFEGSTLYAFNTGNGLQEIWKIDYLGCEE